MPSSATCCPKTECKALVPIRSRRPSAPPAHPASTPSVVATHAGGPSTPRIAWTTSPETVSPTSCSPTARSMAAQSPASSSEATMRRYSSIGRTAYSGTPSFSIIRTSRSFIGTPFLSGRFSPPAAPFVRCRGDGSRAGHLSEAGNRRPGPAAVSHSGGSRRGSPRPSRFQRGSAVRRCAAYEGVDERYGDDYAGHTAVARWNGGCPGWCEDPDLFHHGGGMPSILLITGLRSGCSIVVATGRAAFEHRSCSSGSPACVG